MTEESDGLFDGDRYIWSLGDNSYSQVLSSSERKEWESQYYNYNKMYYNPSVDYTPWPRWNTSADTEGSPAFNADQDTPRSNPVRDDWTLTMNSTFFEVFPALTQGVSVARTGNTGNSTLADAIKLESVDYIAAHPGGEDTFMSSAGTFADNNLIVDNEPDETDHTYTESGSWSWSGSDNPWKVPGGSARYTSDIGASAAWQFSIPFVGGGFYNVYAWVNEYNSRDTAATYTITYNGGVTQDVDMDQAQFGNQWYLLAGTHPISGLPADSAVGALWFNAQTNAGSIDVRNAHYFIWSDDDNDTVQDDGEIYLVNSVGTGGTYSLEFYRFTDNVGTPNDIVEDGELTLITAADTYWDNVQPTNESGTVRTASEERQNFANWFSFYRRRELTAKAAIGRTIDGTEGINIGILGINGRIEQELVPIGVEGDVTKIVDNSDGEYSEQSGGWSNSGSSSPYGSSARYTDDNGGTARWTPTFTASEAGVYTIYAWWNCYGSRDSNAKYTVTDTSGSTDYYKDQRQGGSDGCGQWVLLGVHSFDETGSQYVEVERHGSSTGDTTLADAVKFVSSGAQVTVNESDYLLNELYQVNSSGGTPLRRGLQNAGEYFDNEDSGASGGLSSTAPWADEEDGGGCQRSFAILMTDGYYNGSDPSPSVGNEDSDEDTDYDGGVYAGTGSNTLGDVAMYYYENDLHGDLTDNVAPYNYDTAPHQHMVTYGVSFGVTGTLDPDAYPDCLPETAPGETNADCPTWPTPDSNARKIDDLFHASVNGRGKYLDASNPKELVDALEEIIDKVLDTTGTGSSVSINAQELNEGTMLFQASYITGSWRGDLTAKNLNVTTGAVEDTVWSASEELFSLTQDTRKIITYNGSIGKQFRFNGTLDYLSDDQKIKLLNLDGSRDLSTTPLTTAEETDLQELVEYLRGDKTNEGTASGTFRKRTAKDGDTDIGPLGDIVHSSPLHVGSVVYSGANDGMLHAFDDATGAEIFAYIPNLIYDDLDELASQSYSHNYYVDNATYYRRIVDSSSSYVGVLTGTLGRGGKGVYALNISDVAPATEADAASSIPYWEYPTTPGSDDDLGYTFGKAFTTNTPVGWVTIMGNGYQSTNGKAFLYVFNAETGALLTKIDTGAGSPTVCNGLSEPALVDEDFDGLVDLAYAGDLLGNMWKFDLSSSTVSDWKVFYNTATDYSGTPQPLFQAKNKEGHRQPITTPIDLTDHPDSSLGGFILVFGTGRYLGNADFGDNSVQSLYGIWDWADAWTNAGTSPVTKYLGSFAPEDTGPPEFGRLSYINKPDDQDFEVGQTVTGTTSGSSGEIEEIEALNDTAGTLKLVNLTNGTFQAGEFITSSTVITAAQSDGDMYTVAFRPLTNLEGAAEGNFVTLLEQHQIAFLSEMRFMSDYTVDWYQPGSTTTGAFEHLGWYFDLPGANEKMIREPIIRSGFAFIISSIPSSSPCASGGSSIVHALDVMSGGRSNAAIFDISGPDGVPDGLIDENDLVNIGTPDNPNYVAPTGLYRKAMWFTPAILPVSDSDADIMYFSTSEGEIDTERVLAEKVGRFYWREIY